LYQFALHREEKKILGSRNSFDLISNTLRVPFRCRPVCFGARGRRSDRADGSSARLPAGDRFANVQRHTP